MRKIGRAGRRRHSHRTISHPRSSLFACWTEAFSLDSGLLMAECNETVRHRLYKGCRAADKIAGRLCSGEGVLGKHLTIDAACLAIPIGWDATREGLGNREAILGRNQTIQLASIDDLLEIAGRVEKARGRSIDSLGPGS